MSLTTRCYIFADDGSLKRVPLRVFNDVFFGDDAIPAFAGTTQRAAMVLVRLEDRKPVTILDVHGSLWTFDPEGRLDRMEERRSLSEMFGIDYSPPRSQSDKVVDLTPKLMRRAHDAKFRWEPTKDEIDRLAKDLWPGIDGAAEDVEPVKGKAPRRPPLTWDAKKALSEIRAKLSDVSFAIEELSEPALRGLAFELRRAGTFDRQNVMYAGAAAQCDRQRELKSRRRTGRGVWFAVIEAFHTMPGESISSAHVLASKRCPNKQAAEEAARRLLAEHAHNFSAERTVEASVQSELEWEPDDEGGEA